MKTVIILGAGEQGRVAKHILELSGYSKIKFLDDRLRNDEVIGPLKYVDQLTLSQYEFFVAIGDNSLRKNWFLTLWKNGKHCVNAIHPKAYLESSVKLGTNVMVGAFAYLNINTTVGDGVIINTGCIIEHDNVVGSYSQLGPGVVTAGKVIIGEEVFIGIRSTIIDHCKITNGVILGAGSVVIDDIDEPGLYVGVPVKRKGC